MISSDTEPLNRKERERLRHRGEILVAAERIFALKGYHAATVEEIAKEAEFAIGTLYSLFKGGKEELYARVIENQVQQFVTGFEAVKAIEDPAEAIAAVIRLRLTHFDEHREFVRIALELSPACGMGPAIALPKEVQAVRDQLIREVTEIFRRGIEQGVFDQADPFYYTLCLEGVCNAFVMFWGRTPPAEPLEIRIAKVTREFVGRIRLRLNAPLVTAS